MSDSVIAALSAQGYQPIFLPETGLSPPDIYVFDKNQKKLVRYGPLSGYAREARRIVPKPHKTPSFGNVTTRALETTTTMSLMRRLMRLIGLGGAKVEASFHFAGDSRFRYEFREITVKAVDRHEVQPIVRELKFHNILDSLVTDGSVHLVLEYLYAKRIVMRLADGSDFDAHVTADVEKLVQAAASGRVHREGKGFLTFEAEGEEGAAFAYKALQVFLYDGKLDIGLGAKTLGEPADKEPAPYIPAPGEFLDVEEAQVQAS
jgi:hypothetical protein